MILIPNIRMKKTGVTKSEDAVVMLQKMYHLKVRPGVVAVQQIILLVQMGLTLALLFAKVFSYHLFIC